MGRRIVLLACVLVLLGIPALAASSPWIEVRSRHFRVVTDTSEKQGHDVAQRFEQMRGIFGTMFNKSTLNAPVPLDIVAFRSQDEFMRYVPQWKGKPVSLTGFFQGGEDRYFIGVDMSSSDPYATVFHEYAHVLLHGNFPAMPLWFEEGFAEYFAALKINAGQVEYGDVPPQYASLLAGSQWVPITQLFSVQQDSADYNENDRRSMFYAESWLTVHYLMTNNRLVDAFKYLHLAAIEHEPVPDAIQQAFGVDAATFERNVRASLGSNQVNKQALPGLNDEPYSTKKLSQADADATLADMHAHSRDYAQQALGELQTVLKSDSGNEVANRSLGYWYVQHNQFDQAAQAFHDAQLASKQDDNDSDLHYLEAYLLYRKALKGGISPAEAIVMQQQLERALQLDPSLAAAQNLLAFSFGVQSRYDLAVQAEMSAIALDPSAEMYQANLAHLYIKAGRVDDAEAVLKRIQASSDPKIRENAQQNLAALKVTREQLTEKRRLSAMGISDPTAPQWKMTPDIKKEDSAPPDDTEPKFDTRKTLYLSGELESVDCSGQPAAVVTVRKGAKEMRLRTDDYTKLIVMGADEFSCDWRHKKVLINYKPGGKSDGDLVTLEVEAGK